MAPNKRSSTEDNSLPGRVKRYAKVGTAVGGLAARMAGQRYLGLKADPTKGAEDLRAALGGLKGPLMKVAQILSTIPDALPKEYARELAQLQANAPHMGWPFVKRRMTAELGSDWQNRFAHFEREATAAASLGQVHKAESHDGDTLACKLQYPDMSSVVEADLKQLKLIFSLYRRYDEAIDPSEIHAELADRLREELDYVNEAKNLNLYRQMLADTPGVRVPTVHDDLSTERLLTMSWEQGESIADLEDLSLEDRNTIAENMFRAWYVPLYQYGVIHGDPHLGNYSVRDDLSINLMDFGCIRVFRPEFINGVIDLYRAVETGDRDLAVHAYETWGFVGLDSEVIDTLSRWASFIYAPLLEDRPRLIEETNATDYGREVAMEVHSDLRRLGGVKPPREFVLMDRAAIGLGSVFLRLGAEVNWHRLFHDTIASFDPNVLAKRQKKALKAHDLVHWLEEGA
ncbi:MAG: AarF/ABC1/UbiB kinase family protein [Rhodospirillaceae bacterium]|jgi:predicted unusual protein kinase regulating ubiquinone biosynthesis (AarF/ABC1/UbiB family)|nr:AarF/ABC1/UbiB kinase family protein [Rhodospirillaceae bacterium]MBT5565484.1 AarF/ABC1/UbiB kinase family protein [Rhodospirillaceae bacterium]MBT6089814.1 AarF/ABC1/UbiB kinase family protein [Rhodospirillaceae bacterium]